MTVTATATTPSLKETNRENGTPATGSEDMAGSSHPIRPLSAEKPSAGLHHFAELLIRIAPSTILVDTSVWVDHLRGTDNGPVRRLGSLLRSGSSVCATEPILMELLAGARTDAERHDLRRMITGQRWLPVDPVADFEAAAIIHSACRSAGLPPAVSWTA